MTATRPVSATHYGVVAPERHTPSEAEPVGQLDDLCRSAVEIFAVPMAMVALVDEDRFRFRARYGVEDDGVERESAFCNHTIRRQRGQSLVVPDLIQDERFVENPLVVGDPRARFYAGIAIGSTSGRVIGTLCLMDRVPRSDLSPDRLHSLHELALVAEAHLQLEEARRAAEAEVVERRNADARLAEWEARLRAIEAAHAMAERIAAFGHWRIDVATHTITWSDGIARIFGRNAGLAPLPLETHVGFYHPDDLERVRASIDDAFAGRSQTLGGGYEHRSRLVRPDGEVRVVAVHGVGEHDDAGRLVSIFGVCLDVTELALSEQRLRETGEAMRATLEAMDQGLVMIGPDKRVQVHNQRARDLLELSEDVLHEGASFAAVRRHLAQSSAFRGALTEVQESMQQGDFPLEVQSYECSRPNGTILETRLAPMASGGLVCTYTDLTERRKGEAALRSAEADYQSLFQNAVIGVYRARLDGGIVQANRALDRLHGYGDVPVPLPLSDFSHDWYVEPGRHAAFLKCLTQEGHVEDFVSEIRRHAGGERIWVAETAWVVCDAEGRPIWFEGTVADATERKRAQALIEHMARHDALTGLPNRRLFQETLSREIASARRNEGRVAVLCCDLDRFKAVNDTFGHPAGDALLCIVARRLREVLHEGDVVARLGGDEFAIIMPGRGEPRRIASVARRLIETVGQPIDLDGRATTVGVSIGVAIWPRHGDSADTLFKNADIALYRAKDSGRNTFRFYESGMDLAVATRNLLEIDMRESIRSGGFALHYQPIFGLTDGAPKGFEALLRWEHPVHGPVSPGDFIPLAEETGLITQLGAWALHEACREAAAWPGDLRVAVNVSAVQFRKTGLEQSVVRALAASGLPAGRLELEITESVLMQNSDAVIGCLHRLRAMGVRIALDDFGTGYSSLSYLCRFPFDKIKIDRSFIRDIDEPEAAAVVRAVVGLGERLGMAITAEGVETEEQLARVRRKGCTEVQGFLLGRPLPALQAKALVAERAVA
ncbi:EAL domain-containing protein [Methylobacterium sp. R2-1]|uniref:bifunctional diguanylate cyclase/phosphodiesterase n=1 Tax=Methylobacterium sp. R2-1 TaxID=2587064 RepID=UPI0016103F92|nr:EAL domain-containing protein [Methylobacterium sp. R2-1]MBB2960988.1 diguanylate cyclase (GGDEF)-like protein/PAS domain S-box-containing protein [Methylobacterium sp. R2-1]